jgi:hypothetical protein
MPDPLDSFLSTELHRPSVHCATCRHPNRAAVEDVLLRFNEARRTGATSVKWRNMVREVLAKHYGYTHDHRAVRNHMEDCLGIQQH